MDLRSNLIYSLRLLGKDKSLTAVCLIVVTLGISVTILIYNSIYELRYKTPPFPDGARFVIVKTYDTVRDIESANTAFNAAAFLQIEERVTQFDTIGAFNSSRAVISDEGATRLVAASTTTANLLTLTQIKPLIGRLLTEQDSNPSSQPVALISASLWKSYYAENPDILGQTTRINGTYHTIVGVMPAKYYFPNVVQDIWLPLSLPAASQLSESPNFFVVGKLKKNGSKSIVSHEITQLIRTWEKDYPELYTNLIANTKNYAAISTEGISLFGDLMLAIGIAIFGIACLNLSTLMFLRATSRQQELATRSAIGASRWQLIKHILLESFLICLIGTPAAIALAAIALDILNTQFDRVADLPESISFSLNLAGVFAALLMMVLIWLTSSFITAYRISKQDIARVLENGGKGGTSAGRSIATRSIVFIEVIVSIFLLLVCGLLVNSISARQNYDYGTETAQLVFGQFQLTEETYNEEDERRNFLVSLKGELENTPGIDAVTYTTALPSNFGSQVAYNLEDRDIKENNLYPKQNLIWVDDNYFDVIGVDLLSGRNFLPTDNKTSEQVVIVNKLFVEKMWPNEQVLGKRIQINPENNNVVESPNTSPSKWLTVVGVVEHIVQASPMADRETWTSLYRPIRQDTPKSVNVLVHHQNNLATKDVSRLLISAISTVDRNIPLLLTRSLDDHLYLRMANWGVLADFMVVITIGAFALAIIGIYGLVHKSVVTRFAELGIRRALGSDNISISKIFVIQGLSYLAVGLVIGGTAGVFASSVMTYLFPDILDHLPFILAMLVFAIGSLIFIASYLPARKAVSMEPGDALRYE